MRSVSPDAQLAEVDLGRVEIIHALRSLFGPDGPPTSVLAALAEHTRAVRIPADTALAREGSFRGLVYIFSQGGAHVRRGGRSWGRFLAPAAVGLLEAFAREERSFECITLADSTALAIDADGLIEVLEDHPDLLHRIARGFASGAIELRRKLPGAGFTHAPIEGECWPLAPLDLVERIVRLRRSFGFGNTFITELAQLARAAKEVRHASGARLWSVGDPSDHTVVVLCGTIECCTVDGERFRSGAGDILGNLDAMAQVPRWFQATAVEPVVALELHRESVLDVIEDQPALGFTFLRMVTGLVADLRERVHA